MVLMEGGNLNNFQLKHHMRQMKTPANQAIIAVQLVYLL